MEKQSLFKTTSLLTLLGVGLLCVLLLIPITDNFIEHSKTYVLFFGALLTLALFVIRTFQEKAVRVSVSPVTGALLLFVLATAASTFFTANYPVEGLLGLGGVFISTTIIALFGGSLLPRNNTDKFLYMLTASSVGLTVLTILQMVGFGPAQMLNKILGVSLPTSLVFNLTGSSFIGLQVIALTLLAVFTQVVTTKKLSKFFAVTIPVMVIGLGIFTWSLLPGKETELRLPSYINSWSIMLDTIRSPKSALIGSGVSSYKNAYQIFKPTWINNSNDWSLTFTQAANMPLTIVTTMGVLGLIAWVLVVLKFIKFQKSYLLESKPIGAFVTASFVLTLIMPFNTVLLTLQAIGIACLVANEKHKLPLLQMQALKFKMLNKPEVLEANKKPVNVAIYATTGISMLGVIVLGYLVVRSLQAHVVMAQSTQALAANDIVKGYELQQKAVQLNPYFDMFRRRYSATNALIAIALSNKADITEVEKQQVSDLLQQSVSEGRAATTLDPNESQNWSNLAQIYANMIGISEDAINWTVQSYVSAIETNPNDPLLRLDLAKIFVEQEAYQQALSIYDQAIALKPDLAISHFNRAQMLEKLETPEAIREARASYQRTLVLLSADTEDYVAVNKKIEEIEAYMKENNISLEPETTGEQATQNNAGAPSITEQNLNDSNTVDPDDQPVTIAPVSPEPSPETTPLGTPEDAMEK